MKLNTNFKNWLVNQQKGYVQHGLDMDKFTRFDLGECTVNTFTASNEIKDFEIEKVRGYPDPDLNDLKKLISKIYSLPIDMLTLSSGADELIETLPRIFINPGDCAVIVTPTFFRFIDSTQKQGGEIIAVKTKEIGSFEINEKIINEVIKVANKNNAHLIWLCSPNNPTGLPIDINLIEKVIKNTKAFVVLDQVFAELLNNSETYTFPLKKLKKYDNFIVIKSLSKAYGMAGLRIGFGIANPKIIRIFEQFRMHFNIASASKQLAMNVLKDITFLRQTRKIVEKERAYLFSKIKKLKNLNIGSLSQTNVFMLKHTSKDLFKELFTKKILTADIRSSLGLEKMSYIRITIQDRKKNDILLKALKEID